MYYRNPDNFQHAISTKPQTNNLVIFHHLLGLWLLSLISGKPPKDDRCISTQCEIHQHKCMFGNLLISSMSYFCLVHAIIMQELEGRIAYETHLTFRLLVKCVKNTMKQKGGDCKS